MSENLHGDSENLINKCLVELFVFVFSQDLGLSTHDVLLLLYGHASALTAIGKHEVTRLPFLPSF